MNNNNLKICTLNVSRRRFQEGAYMSHLYQATSSEGVKEKSGGGWLVSNNN
jgi:hypothetical protein